MTQDWKQSKNKRRRHYQKILSGQFYWKEKRLQNVRIFVCFAFTPYVILKGKTVKVASWPSLALRPPLVLLWRETKGYGEEETKDLEDIPLVSFVRKQRCKGVSATVQPKKQSQEERQQQDTDCKELAYAIEGAGQESPNSSGHQEGSPKP